MSQNFNDLFCKNKEKKGSFVACWIFFSSLFGKLFTSLKMKCQPLFFVSFNEIILVLGHKSWTSRNQFSNALHHTSTLNLKLCPMPIQSQSCNVRLCVCMCLCKTPTSGGFGDLCSKNNILNISMWWRSFSTHKNLVLFFPEWQKRTILEYCILYFLYLL